MSTLGNMWLLAVVAHLHPQPASFPRHKRVDSSQLLSPLLQSRLGDRGYYRQLLLEHQFPHLKTEHLEVQNHDVTTASFRQSLNLLVYRAKDPSPAGFQREGLRGQTRSSSNLDLLKAMLMHWLMLE